MADYAEMISKLQGPSLLQQAGQAIELQQHAQTLQMQQQELAARTALGPILQRAIDPKTGELDVNKYFVGAAANPATAWKAEDILRNGIAMKATQAETALRELDKNMRQQNSIADAASALLAGGPNTRREDVMKQANYMYKTGQIDQEHLLELNRRIDGVRDGAPMYNVMKQLALQAQGTAKTMEGVYSDINAQEQGGAFVFSQRDKYSSQVRQVPFVGPAGQSGALPKTLTPEKKGELIEGIDYDGSLTGVRGSLYKKPYEDVFPEQGRPSGPSAPAGRQGAGATAPSGSPPQRLLITGRPPQEAEALKKIGDQYGQVVELYSANRTFGSALDEAEKLLKEYTPGAGADIREKIANGLSAIGVSKDVVNQVNMGSLKGGQVFKSVMLDLAAARMKKALEGGGRFTNLEWTGYTETKPNPEMSVEAVRELIQYYRKTIKMEDAYVKGYLHYVDPRSGKNPLDFQKWWAGIVDKVRDVERKEREKK